MVITTQTKNKIICDTNVWYDIASGKIKPEKLTDIELYSTYVNLFELAKSQNLVKDWRLVKYAVKALRTYSTGIYETNPIEFIIQKQFPHYKIKDVSYKEILSGFEVLLQRDDKDEVDAETLKKMQSSVDQFAQASQKAADGLNAKLPEIRKKIKEGVGKKEHRKLKSYPLLYEVINVFVQQQTQGEVSLDIEKYPWEEITLFVKVWDNYFKELEVSGNQKFQPNDWQDIFATVYSDPNKKFSTAEEKWISLIENDPDTKNYLVKLS